jgi:hypothetical protein
MNRTAAQVREELRELTFARDMFPMLTSWGVEDFSVTIHSLGCSYLSALGRHLEHWAMADYPVKLLHNGNSRAVRPDVVWWSRSDESVALIGEFERFQAGQEPKLAGKARNLLETYHALDRKPAAVLLLAWTVVGTDLGRLGSVRAVGYEGFRSREGKPVPGVEDPTEFILATAIFGQTNGAWRLQEVCL